jgi:hypothetical protein
MSSRLPVSLLTLSAFLTIASVSAQEAAAPQTEQQMRGEISRQGGPSLGLGDIARIARGYVIAPVKLDLRHKDPFLVGLGSYLVNATGGCNDCHTNPPFAEGGDPFLGQPKQINAANYLAGGTMFGPFRSRNITPNAAGLPGGLTWEQFRRTMRTGIDIKERHPEISPLLQVMPWPVYQDLVERDLRAIYEYLRAIPHAERAPSTTP